MRFAGGTPNAKFIAFIRDDLCPHFHRGGVVVKDNLRQHKQAEAERLLKRRRCHILYLPPYNPDFNSIELSFSKVQMVLCKRCIRDINKRLRFVKNVPKLITQDDCRGYDKYCGYGS